MMNRRGQGRTGQDGMSRQGRFKADDEREERETKV